jgi:hypothetical protein
VNKHFRKQTKFTLSVEELLETLETNTENKMDQMKESFSQMTGIESSVKTLEVMFFMNDLLRDMLTK